MASTTPAEIRDKLIAQTKRDEARLADLRARSMSFEADRAAAVAEARSFLINAAQQQAEEKRKAAEADPVGDAGRAIAPGPIQPDGSGVSAGGFSLGGVSGGASGGQGAQQVLNDAQGRPPGSQQPAPTQTLRSRSVQRGLEPIATGLRADVTREQVTDREEFVPGQLSQAQRITGGLALQRRRQELEETEFSQLSPILRRIRRGDATADEREFVTAQLLGMDEAKRRRLTQFTLGEESTEALTHRNALSALGKVEQDFRAGLINEADLPRAREAALDSGGVTVNVGDDLESRTRGEIENRLLGMNQTRDQLVGQLNSFRPELAGRLAQAKAFGLGVAEQVAGIPIIGDVVAPTPEQEAFLDDFRTFYNRTSRTTVETLKAMSGATVSPSEAPRFDRLLVKPGDSASEVRTKLRESMLEINLALAKGRLWQRQGGPETIKPWEISGLNAFQEIDQAADRKFNELRQANPNVDERQLAREAVGQVEAIFNLTPGGYRLIAQEFQP